MPATQIPHNQASPINRGHPDPPSRIKPNASHHSYPYQLINPDRMCPPVLRDATFLLSQPNGPQSSTTSRTSTSRYPHTSPTKKILRLIHLNPLISRDPKQTHAKRPANNTSNRLVEPPSQQDRSSSPHCSLAMHMSR